MTARARFVAIRKAVIELETVQALITECGDDWKPDSVGHVLNVDGVANKAIYNVEVLSVRLAELQAREAELIELIGNGLKDIERVRAGLSDRHASVLEQRYIDVLPWRYVEYGGRRVKLSTGKKLVAEAFKWLDDNPNCERETSTACI